MEPPQVLQAMKDATRKIVALGGGEIGRPGYPVETTGIDEEIIRLAGRSNPHLLFFPAAAGDSESYYEAVRKHFGRTLGCQTDVLYLIKERPTTPQIERKVSWADIVYVGGGNTLRLMKACRKSGTDAVLRRAWQTGTVLSGLSAGAICWFAWGNSDARKFKDPAADLIRVRGLGFVNALFCPHYDVERDRRTDLKKMMRRAPGVAIAVDNCCAVEIVDDAFRIISSKPEARAYRVYWAHDAFHEERIEKAVEFKPLSGLVTKPRPAPVR